MEGLPFWAILEAYERFRSGETLRTWNKAFRPTPPEFADEVREGLADLRRQQIQIRDILDAEILPPVDPEMVARARQLAAEVSASNAASRRDSWKAAPDVRDGAEILPADRAEIIAGPPIKPGALGASALGKFLPSYPVRRTSGQPAA